MELWSFIQIVGDLGPKVAKLGLEDSVVGVPLTYLRGLFFRCWRKGHLLQCASHRYFVCSFQAVSQSRAAPAQWQVVLAAWKQSGRQTGTQGLGGSCSYSVPVSGIQGGHGLVVGRSSETPGEDLRVTWWVTVWGVHVLSVSLEPQATYPVPSSLSVLVHLLCPPVASFAHSLNPAVFLNVLCTCCSLTQKVLPKLPLREIRASSITLPS